MKNILKNKKTETISFCIGLLLLIVGTSYAIWTYVFSGNINKIQTASIELDLLESNTNIITIENALPKSDDSGKSQSETFDFAVTSKTRREVAVGYSIVLEKLEVDPGYTSLTDKDIKIYLTDYSNVQLLKPVLVEQLEDKVIYSATNEHDSSHETIQRKFKLRAWIDEAVEVADWDQSTKLQYKFKIGVRKDSEVKIRGLLYNIVKDGAVLDTNVDFSEVPTGTNKKYIFNSTKDDHYPVYYYRGNVNNNYVKFGGFCWRAVRTTSTGGTKLIYSGTDNNDVYKEKILDEYDYDNISNNNDFIYNDSSHSYTATFDNSYSKSLSLNLGNGDFAVQVVSSIGSGSSLYVSYYYNNSYLSNMSYETSSLDETHEDYQPVFNCSSDDSIKVSLGGNASSSSPVTVSIKIYHLEGKNVVKSSYKNVSNSDNWEYDSADNSWNITITDGQPKELSFNLTSDIYSMDLSGTTSSGAGGSWYVYKNDIQIGLSGAGGGSPIAASYIFNYLNNTDVVKFKYTGSSSIASPITFKIKMNAYNMFYSGVLKCPSFLPLYDNFYFDCYDRTWNIRLSSLVSRELSFDVPNGDYDITLEVVYGGSTASGTITMYEDESSLFSITYSRSSGLRTKTVSINNVTRDNKIKLIVSPSVLNSSKNDSISLKMYMVNKKNQYLGKGCLLKGENTQLPQGSRYNTNSNSFAYNGYMYGELYNMSSGRITYGSLVGESFDYNNGEYVLKKTQTSLDNNHHYTCNNESGKCSDLRYYFYRNGAYNYYIELKDGKGISDAIMEMQNNINDSTIKSSIDSWYSNNMSSYTDMLEDTPWCNDRSTDDLKGWSPSGNLDISLKFNSANRRNNNEPSLACINKNDAFTVNDRNGNGALSYPIALLTADELTLAGNSSYLNNENDWWTMSPNDHSALPRNYYFTNEGNLNGTNYLSTEKGVRPAISLKHNMVITDGDGTSTNPFVVE